MREPVKAGAAGADITPPVGVDLSGFGGRPSGNIGIHDNLFAKALVVDDGDAAAAFVTCDLIGLSDDLVRYVRAAVERTTSIPGDNVMFSASHTHSGPCTALLHGMGQPNERYLDFVAHAMVSIVRSAFDSREKAAIRHGRCPAQVGINRRERQPEGGMRLGRNPGGPIAPHVDVIRADGADGSAVAVLFAHAAHPVTLGGSNLYVSADFPGYAQRFVARACGDGGTPVVAMFAQGCCGNINCEREEGTFAQARRLGQRLGAAAVKTAEYAETIPEPRIASAHETVDLPLQDPPPLSEAEAQLDQQRGALASARESGAPRGRIQLHEGLVTWAEKVRDLARDGARDRTQAFHMHAIRLGPVVVVGLPGEVFVEYAHALEEASPAPHTVVLGYTNGCIGYVPTEAAFDEGGYEVDKAIRYYGTT
ncbi:MAG: neutral/alkaline non-lysosomal ceramidase N-terminal domain-containing protein, partial [Armatimonadota bacterium]